MGQSDTHTVVSRYTNNVSILVVHGKIKHNMCCQVCFCPCFSLSRFSGFTGRIDVCLCLCSHIHLLWIVSYLLSLYCTQPVCIFLLLLAVGVSGEFVYRLSIIIISLHIEIPVMHHLSPYTDSVCASLLSTQKYLNSITYWKRKGMRREGEMSHFTYPKCCNA